MIRFVFALSLMLCLSTAAARDYGQWDGVDPAVQEWYRTLKQPDNKTISCCGEADAYWADSFEVDGDRYVAIVTDTRPDGPLYRPHVEPGTRIVIPKHKLKYDQGNPTGHGIVFLGSPNKDDNGVYCYLPPGGT